MGVGKTRLATEVAAYAANQGFLALLGHCYEREEPCPYLPFAEILETALSQAPSPQEFRQWLGDTAAELAPIAPSLPGLPGSVEIELALFSSLQVVPPVPETVACAVSPSTVLNPAASGRAEKIGNCGELGG